MLDLNENILDKLAGLYSGKLFKVVDDFKYEIDAQTSITVDNSNNLRLEIIMDGCESGETMPLAMKEVGSDMFEVCCNDQEECLEGKVDLLNRMLSFKVESPRSGETEFVGCI
ncbi:hypothetical protein [Flammeovirga sp. EKP202]|uniref:hypothetical protein n=1 Tax=Flammeovirga sp. EKP202 TaxID=2770592 RepID=UPI00165FB879|nr:hypothetical protein [Flammeovirga sp. EKP202]MBD0403600.1 hypothetical protein [Flammeovirga sp. EKP202]